MLFVCVHYLLTLILNLFLSLIGPTEAGKSVLNAFHMFGPISRLTHKPATLCSVESDQLVRIDAAEREKLITVTLEIMPVRCSHTSGTSLLYIALNVRSYVCSIFATDGLQKSATVLPSVTNAKQY